MVLLTGASGFVGRAVMRCATALKDLTIIPIARESALAQVREASRSRGTSRVSILNLAWPSLQNYSSLSHDTDSDDQEWFEFKDYIRELVTVSSEADIRFFHVGSGIERYADGVPATVRDPYLSYAKRKSEIWDIISQALPNSAWRLRLHFLFGQGELQRRFVPAAIGSCRRGRPVIVGVPSRRRCWLHVDDAAAGLLSAVEQPMPENWDICGHVAVSFEELLNCIAAVTGKEARIVEPETEIADANCPIVEPEHPAPFLPPGLGGEENLRQRLNEYVQTFTSDRS